MQISSRFVVLLTALAMALNTVVAIFTSNMFVSLLYSLLSLCVVLLWYVVQLKYLNTSNLERLEQLTEKAAKNLLQELSGQQIKKILTPHQRTENPPEGSQEEKIAELAQHQQELEKQNLHLEKNVEFWKKQTKLFEDQLTIQRENFKRESDDLRSQKDTLLKLVQQERLRASSLPSVSSPKADTPSDFVARITEAIPTITQRLARSNEEAEAHAATLSQQLWILLKDLQGQGTALHAVQKQSFEPSDESLESILSEALTALETSIETLRQFGNPETSKLRFFGDGTFKKLKTQLGVIQQLEDEARLVTVNNSLKKNGEAGEVIPKLSELGLLMEQAQKDLQLTFASIEQNLQSFQNNETEQLERLVSAAKELANKHLGLQQRAQKLRQFMKSQLSHLIKHSHDLENIADDLLIKLQSDNDAKRFFKMAQDDLLKFTNPTSGFEKNTNQSS